MGGLFTVKFIQTSDWQIGMKGSGLGEAGPIVRETRIESINNIMKSASREDVDFILLCGDIFEHNMVGQEEVQKVISIINKYPDVPFYLLPGNHDILGPGSIYERPIFQNVENLTIINSEEPIVVNGATLHPCPVTSKFSKKDASSVIPNVNSSSGVHIGIAHGSLVGKFPESNWESVVLPIEPSCVDRTGVDFLALGHWHSFRTYEDGSGITRLAYSGTHEQTNYGEDTAGQCLLVQIDEKGKIPIIQCIKTGKLTWEYKEFEIKDFYSLEELKTYLKSVQDVDMVKLSIYGELQLDFKNELDNILEFQKTLHKDFKVDLDSLKIVAPVGLEDKYDYGDPTLNKTDFKLKKLLSDETDPLERRIISEAIGKLRRFKEEVG